MRILFISANTEKINIVPMPLGLINVAAATETKGHDVLLMDLMVHEDFRLPIKNAMDSFSPDVIGVSVRNIDDQVMRGVKFLLSDVKTVVDYCRSLSRAPLVLGGAGYSIFPRAVLEYLDADMGIQGEGETAFPQLLDCLERHADPEKLPGLYRKNRGSQMARTFIRDLNTVSPSAAEKFLSGYDRNLWMPFQTRRGCPQNCIYCSTAAIEGRTLRKRSPEKAVEELKRYVGVGFRQFYFVDNTFNLPASYAKALCRLIIQNRLSISWRCIFYPGKVDEELINLMAQAGCREVSLGFESGCDRMLKNMKKRFTPDDVRQTSRTLAHYGIGRMGFLMLGGPGETKESVLESLNFADSLCLDSVKVSQGIRIYPYTTLAKIAVREGRIAPDDTLLTPAFYMVREIEEWLKETVENRLADRPNWIG